MPEQLSKLETATVKARERLERHVNECYWCKFHPFARCGTGAELLRAIPFQAPNAQSAS